MPCRSCLGALPMRIAHGDQALCLSAAWKLAACIHVFARISSWVSIWISGSSKAARAHAAYHRGAKSAVLHGALHAGDTASLRTSCVYTGDTAFAEGLVYWKHCGAVQEISYVYVSVVCSRSLANVRTAVHGLCAVVLPPCSGTGRWRLGSFGST